MVGAVEQYRNGAMTLAQLTEKGQTLDWCDCVPSRKPVSPPRTVQAARWVGVWQVRLGGIGNEGCSEMLIIGFGVTELLLSTLVFTCETCGNHAAHQLTKQSRKFSTFLHSVVLGWYKNTRQLYRLWADHRGQ